MIKEKVKCLSVAVHLQRNMHHTNIYSLRLQINCFKLNRDIDQRYPYLITLKFLVYFSGILDLSYQSKG